MKTSQELVNKDSLRKMISLPTISLAPEEADRFIDYIVDQSVLKNNARVIKMGKESKTIRALGLGSGRFLHPADTFGTSDYKKQLSHNVITLTSKKARGCVVIYDDDLEDNIEGNAFKDHLMQMITKQIANELEEAFYIADTHGWSGFTNTDIRSMWDGWRYRLDNSQATEQYYNDVTGACNVLSAQDTNVFQMAGKIAMVDNSAPYNWEFKFHKMIETLPSQYKVAGLDNFRFFCPDIVVQNYIEALTARATVLGDSAILGKGQYNYQGIPIVSVPTMPTTMGASGSKEKYGTGDYADCILTHRDNFIVGIQRDIRLEPQREAADEATYFFYSIRCDLAIENVNAAVLLKRLTVSGSMVG